MPTAGVAWRSVTAGTCTITASQAGNSTYAAATSVSQSFTVNAAALKSQTITFNPIAAQTVGKSLTVSATASSGLPVSFVPVQNGNCIISGNVVTFLNQGNCESSPLRQAIAPMPRLRPSDRSLS